MVLPGIFNKSPFSKKKSTIEESEDDQTPPPSPPKSSRSPKKSPTKAGREREPRPNSAQSSRSWSKAAHSPRYSTYDRNSHPLNLPPHELKRLSAMSQRSDSPVPMDIDQEDPISPLPSSPQPATNGHASSPSHPDAEINGDSGPLPPPYKPSSPQPPTVDPEVFKAAGNKFFKAKEYDKAVKEYTKGKSFQLNGIMVTSQGLGEADRFLKSN
jgi:DnaJ family protein C protein 7